MTAPSLTVTFQQGTLARLSVTFTRRPTQAEIAAGTATDADDWQLEDPDAVDAKVMDPAAVVSDHSYLDSPNDIVRDSIGAYHLDVTPDVPGTWYFRFEGTGAVQAVAERRFLVDASAFP